VSIVGFDCEWRPEGNLKAWGWGANNSNGGTVSEEGKGSAESGQGEDGETVEGAEEDEGSSSSSSSVSSDPLRERKRDKLRRFLRSRIDGLISTVRQLTTEKAPTSSMSPEHTAPQAQSSSTSAAKPKRRKKREDETTSNPVIVLQLATRNFVFVIDLLRLCRQSAPGTSHALVGSALTPTEQVLDEVLHRVFGLDDVVKVGLGPAQDLKRLAWSYPWLPSMRYFTAVLDIAVFAKKAHPTVSSRDLDGLSKLCLRFLGRPVDKTQQCSDWSQRPLTPLQVAYASTDAHVLTRLFDLLSFYSEVSVVGSKDIVAGLCNEYHASLPTDVACTLARGSADIDGADKSEGGTGANKDGDMDKDKDKADFANFVAASAPRVVPLRRMVLQQKNMHKKWTLPRQY